MQNILTSTNDKLLTQSDLVVNLKIQIANFESMVAQKDKQLQAYELAKKDLEKALKRERRTKKLYKIGATVGAAAVLLNVLGK